MHKQFKFIFILFFFIGCFCSSLFSSGVSLDITAGPENFVQKILAVEGSFSKKINAHAGYEHTNTSGYSSPVQTYFGSATLMFKNNIDLEFGFSNSPEVDGAKSSGWHLMSSYFKYRRHYGIGISLELSKTSFSEHLEYQEVITIQKKRNLQTIINNKSEVLNLSQASLEPAVYFILSDYCNIDIKYIQYYYTQNLDDFSDRLSNLSMNTLDTINMGSTINGFCDHIISSNLNLGKFNKLYFLLNWTRAEYALSQSTSDSMSINIFYIFKKQFRFKIGLYQDMETQDKYFTAGIKWLL